MNIRTIQPNDNKELAKVIRDVLTEFGVNKPGTVFTDPTTDHLFELFQTAGASYSVLEKNGQILGGCGLYPTKGLPTNCVELVKLYVGKEARNLGLGKRLMLECIEQAKEFGYQQVYLETLPELSNAVQLYGNLGFKELSGPLGDSGHHACSIWMLLEL